MHEKLKILSVSNDAAKTLLSEIVKLECLLQHDHKCTLIRYPRLWFVMFSSNTRKELL